MTFIKSRNRDNTYHVVSGGKITGTVRKVEAWVVRGTRITWEAYHAGKYLGSYETRNKAGASLCH